MTEPVNVQSQVVFNASSPTTQPIYTVPDGKMLIIEDASAGAFDSATASNPGGSALVPTTYCELALATNINVFPPLFGPGVHVIAAGVGLPMVGGRRMRGYAAPGSTVFFQISNCFVKVNAIVSFSGRLVDYPPPTDGA
jgi:hypothetical protein